MYNITLRASKLKEVKIAVAKFGVYFRAGLTEIDCVLCGKRKKDVVKKKHKNNANNSSVRCECTDVSYCQPCKDDMKARSGPKTNGNKIPYG